MDADVLIIGAGPTGLMLANQLVRRGLRIIIIDRHSGASLQTRALGVQARTLEIYAKLGIAARALELGKPATGANLWAQGKMLANIPLAQAGLSTSAFPYILILGQDDNERIMGDHLRNLGGAVRWNTELIGLVQDDNAVTASLRYRDGVTTAVTASWVAGCDGAKSAVRELNSISFEGAPYHDVFFVADTEVAGGMVPDQLNIYLWRSGFHLMFPMRGKDHWRIVGIVPPNLQHRDGLKFEDVIPSLQSEVGANLNIKSCTWFSTYRIHHRYAARFREGRCFLLGDAAHIHSPVGAQGMNTGLQDSYNLAWKLALAAKGEASSALLDTYEQERLPVARRLLNTTDQAFRMIVADNWFAGLMRTKILARLAAFAMRWTTFQSLAFNAVSQTAIHYRKSTLSLTSTNLPDNSPQAGDRFPWLHLALESSGPVKDLFEELDDTTFNLLLFGQGFPSRAAPERPDLFRVHVFPTEGRNVIQLKRFNIPSIAYYFLRPDGHIGLCGTQFDLRQLHSYLADRLHFNVAAVST